MKYLPVIRDVVCVVLCLIAWSFNDSDMSFKALAVMSLAIILEIVSSCWGRLYGGD